MPAHREVCETTALRNLLKSIFSSGQYVFLVDPSDISFLLFCFSLVFPVFPSQGLIFLKAPTALALSGGFKSGLPKPSVYHQRICTGL